MKRGQGVKRWKISRVYGSYFIIHLNSAPISHKSHPPHNYCSTLKGFLWAVIGHEKCGSIRREISCPPLLRNVDIYSIRTQFPIFRIQRFQITFDTRWQLLCIAVLNNNRSFSQNSLFKTAYYSFECGRTRLRKTTACNYQFSFS
jgi:hypothetical protein